MYYLMQALQTNHRLPSIRQKENCVIDSCYLTSLHYNIKYTGGFALGLCIDFEHGHGHTQGIEGQG
jgi:hypothetical protein